MKPETEMKLQRILLYLVIALSCYLLLSCTKRIYVPVESVRTEYRDFHTRDSVHLRDSIFVMLKGDTVWIEKYKTVYHDRWMRDSVYLNDTIRVPYPVQEIVYKNKQNIFQKSFMYSGIVALLFLIVRIVFRLRR